MLRLLIGIILIMWLVGLVGGVGGSLIHLLLVVAAIVLVFDLLAGRRAAI